MAQSDALSYLLFGRPIGRTTSSSDRDAVQSATSSLAAGGGNLLGAEIGRQLGLDELSFQSAGEDGQDIALQVGAYLSPRLYIQYVTELAAASNQVKLRYDLTERIQVQTETGTVHGADVFYTIER
jgi:translocation and assembly module TamB